MSITRGEWLRQAEAARKREGVETSVRHTRYVEAARLKGIRNLTAEEYCATAALVADGGFSNHYPLAAPAMFNASSEPCDMWNGHCSCGANHRDGI